MVSPKEKTYRLAAEDLKPVAVGYGGCFATDMITIEGRKVAFMYRKTPERDSDSGWRFMSGYESDEYMDEPGNHGIFDVNTIANYDGEIIPFLGAAIGTAYERKDGEGPLLLIHDFTLPE